VGKGQKTGGQKKRHSPGRTTPKRQEGKGFQVPGSRPVSTKNNIIGSTGKKGFHHQHSQFKRHLKAELRKGATSSSQGSGNATPPLPRVSQKENTQGSKITGGFKQITKGQESSGKRKRGRGGQLKKKASRAKVQPNPRVKFKRGSVGDQGKKKFRVIR